MDEIMKKRNYILDTPIKKVWNLNELHVGETLTGIPTASHYINRKGHEFLVVDLDYGYAVCKIFFFIFSFPEQKILNSKYHNSFELVKYYRQSNGIPVDDNITQLHDINWQNIIDWLNSLQIVQIKVISKNLGGFRNIKFLSNETFK